uniref:RING-type domain-containing protein n=1 Tax=Schistocephalus solidus TaxID=70667 RepID=A0A183ST03_SCHSO
LVLEQPRSLPCGHVFCHKCLRAKMVELGGQKSVKCIFCDKVFLVDHQESCISIAFEYKAFVDLLEAGELSGNVTNVHVSLVCFDD